MFETRLKILLVFLLFAAGIIVARLFDMQVLHAETYRQQAEEALVLPAKVLPAVRGRILDRTGSELVSDEPSWEVRVHYDVLSMNTSGVRNWCRKSPAWSAGLNEASDDEREAWFRSETEAMWHALGAFGIMSEGELRAEAEDICERVTKIHAQVSKRRGFDSPVREERMSHAVIDGLNDQQQIAARSLASNWPWVVVEDATHRVYHAGPAFGHLLGRLGPVSSTVIDEDPYADNPLRSYMGNEQLGVSGIEKVAEDLLRGTRGRYRENRDGVVLEDVAAKPGDDVRLTIRRDLQDELYKLFGEHIAKLPFSTGGAVVVLDVKTRDCLALVSYPGYDPSTYRERYDDLRSDTRHQPLRFRAVANRYVPGSIVKPLVCLAGLITGEINLDTHFDCQGALFPEHSDRWRCWPNQSGARMHHGSLDVTGGIKHSCNIFMYHTAQLVGVERLTNYFEMAGLGEPTGTGLIEESPGINPTPLYLEEYSDGAVTAGRARLYGIGQGEVSVTPIQAANLMAVYASGEKRYVNLVEEMRHEADWPLPGTPPMWAAIRRGLYGVVNDNDGTAHRTAYIDPSCGYALCGKTGSAEVSRSWNVSYRIPYVDDQDHEHVAIIRATSRNEAHEVFVHKYPGCAFAPGDVKVAEQWPDRLPEHRRKHSHAWFAGYLAPVDGAGNLRSDRTPPIAFALLVEFGGSGGRVAAPIGREVARKLIEVLGPDLDADAPPYDPQKASDGVARADGERTP
ncbi:MAG: hypothetical protein H6817_08185 [Phycisphaerales bacterium]|nr:hypothetical protein [Phycisphaerales bacterium]